MKILLVNKFFYPRGGDFVVLFATADLLEKNGHKPIPFSMDHPQNFPSPFSQYFVSNVDLNNAGSISQQLRVAMRILYSFEAKDKISRLIKQETPDIAHLHNIHHHISPSIIDALKKSQIPMVMTLHDYKLVCPAYYLLRNGHPCENCCEGRYYHCFINHCARGGSYLKSALNMLEMYLHHQILRIYEKVDLLISPSRFLMKKVEEMGFQGKIVYLSNFIDPQKYVPSYDWRGKSIVYFGRLSSEKGLNTLVNAVKGVDVQLKIIGDGPQKDRLAEKVKSEGLKNVIFLGYKQGNELQDEIKQSMFVVLPSEWYENNPCTVFEAFALGKPVIGSRIGGIPELVKDGETGLTFEPSNCNDLKEKIEILTQDNELIVKMGKKARIFVEKELNPKKHYERLMKIYKQVLTDRSH